MAKELKSAGYYKAKGVVEALAGRYVAEVAMLDSGDVVRVDQAQLETVIPSPGGRVLVVNGQYRGARGELVQIDTGRFQAQVVLSSGADSGRKVWLEYEDVCKYQGGGGASKQAGKR
jgi:DNA/RNA-binding protein KIN17